MSGYFRSIAVPVETPPSAEAASLVVADHFSEAEDSPTSGESSTAKSSPTAEASLPAQTSCTTETSDQSDHGIVALRDCFQKATDLQVWNHCMGGDRVPDIPAIADALANHVILVCLDCEHWSNNTDETTEVGIATFARHDMLPLVTKGDYGDYAENLMQQVKFYLLRMTETSHLPNQNPTSRGVRGNRFGQGHFVSFSEARQIMYNLFVQRIENITGMNGNHPIVVLGHDVGHDKNNLKHKAIAFDMDPVGTVVRYIDTQAIARDVMYWLVPRNEQIGLKRLVEELWFEHSDPHTAANDAGRTLISAFQLALGNHPCKKNAKKSMLQVATGIEEYSVANFKPLGGVEKYCWKCGVAGHMKPECEAKGLYCDECEENGCEVVPGEEHVTAHCMCIANKKADARRARDAEARALRRPRPNHRPRRGNHVNSRGQSVQRSGPFRQPVRATPTQRHGRPLGGNGHVTSSCGGHPFNRTYRGGHGEGSFGCGSGGSSAERGGRGF